MRRVGPGAHVDDVELRVADGLGEHETRLVVREPGDGVGVVGIGPAHLDAVLRQRVREQVVRAPVQRRDRDDVVAGSRDVEHGVGHGGLSGGRRAGSEPALERRDALLEDVPRRVHDARVDVARHLEREQVGGVLGVVELVRRRLVDRHCACLRGRVRGLTAVQGDRLGALSTHERSSRFASRERKRPPVSRRAFGVAERSTNRLSSSALRTRDGDARRWTEHLPGRGPGCCGVVGPVPSTARDDVASGSLAHATRSPRIKYETPAVSAVLAGNLDCILMPGRSTLTRAEPLPRDNGGARCFGLNRLGTGRPGEYNRLDPRSSTRVPWRGRFPPRLQTCTERQTAQPPRS